MDRRPKILSIVVPLIVGLSGLITVLARPRAAAYATVDVLELVAGGLCLGIALVAIVQWLKGDQAS